MAPIVLHGLHRSVYTRIAAMTLLEKGISFELQEVEIFGPTGVPALHLERHPFGRIPVLQRGDLLLYETQAICRYVDEAFDGPKLQPGAPLARARMAQTVGVLDSYAYRPMVWDVFVQRVGASLRGQPADEAVIEAAMPKVRTVLRVLSELLGPAPYFGGDMLSLADLHAYPMLTLLSLAAEGDAAIREHSSLVGWFANLSGRPSAVKTKTKYEQGAAASAA
jgi:glutathione S-transferase